jgi:hypothetical protein
MTPTPDEYPARISSYQQNEAWFGSVDLGTRQARGVDYHRKPQKVIFSNLIEGADQNVSSKNLVLQVNRYNIYMQILPLSVFNDILPRGS